MNLHSMISALKPLKMLVLNVNMHTFFDSLFNITFIAAHFVMKVNINDVLNQKLLPFEIHAASTPVSTRLVARQIVLHEECVKKNLVTKTRSCRLSMT